MSQHEYISYPEYQNLIRTLAVRIKEADYIAKNNIKYVAPILRGGLIPAAMLAYALGLPLIKGISARTVEGIVIVDKNTAVTSVSHSQVLYVDDLIDSGATGKTLNTLGIPHITAPIEKASKLWTNPVECLRGESYPDSLWLIFPWEDPAESKKSATLRA